ncbi:hypothetical protein L915_12689 [Phytophthora nicotianae]|uniref:Uncharacterized protein n=3 Tax=Phytophthora nicotianae TaxID=4792 RepID=W2R3K4_PHYN3|nr:hypothetical protein PPTG_03074 [Phytophthora nicotianae INRA-310]ETK81831.1 hypothetical protein L915_12689 [Phytophthora nicotianae]ETL35241.1 hypothetical protein L916_12597 [Phytophthora nicotianae]ETN19968.1 hypothetical protein PPTG_03074 [Phytophthora nicotianae INRA-310]ETO70425.1 hypothetical protein F444_13091 [Phytophthora nicotianae P1976]
MELQVIDHMTMSPLHLPISVRYRKSPAPFSSMFANHLVTIAPHAAVIVSPVDHSSQQRSSSTTGNSSRHTKKQRAKSEDLNSNNNKKEAATSRYSS